MVLESIDVRAQQSSSSISAGAPGTAFCVESSRTLAFLDSFISLEMTGNLDPL